LSLYALSLKNPLIKGNTPRAKFCSISIIPNPVPIILAGTSIGTVGTIIEQKIAIQIPNRIAGIHLTILFSRKLAVAYANIMKMYVNV
jgi:hypothetical protein